MHYVDGRPKQKTGTVNYITKKSEKNPGKYLDKELRKYIPLRVYKHKSIPQPSYADCIQHLV